MLAAGEILLLLERIAFHSDEAALKRLFDEFYPRLLLFADSFLQNRPVAEEVVEDVFIKLWENKRLLPSISGLPAYLYRATRNNVLNYQKRVQNQASLDLNDIHTELIASIKNPEELLISAEMIRSVNEAVSALPSRCRLIFRLVKEDGLRYKEVAGILNISIKTVEHQMSLALKKISEALLLSQPGTCRFQVQKNK